MPKENLNPEGDEIVKDQLNPEEEESEEEDLEFLDEDFEESDEEPEKSDEEEDKPDEAIDSLAAYNAEMKKRGLNYNFKSWDDVYKSNKAAADAISKKGMEEKKEEVVVEAPKETVVTPVTTVPNISERLLKVEQPESVFVLEDIKRDHPGKDVYDVWNSSEYYKREALVRAETERNKTRISTPSGGSEEKPEVDEVEQKFVNNLPDKYKK